jgi:4'-phosphopantetheinyl transferase EntD
VIDAILPAGVTSAEAFGGPVPAPLFPGDAEPAELARWSEERRREFATGRALARRALCGAGLPPVAIPRDAQGAPVWPPGTIGSVTHCPGYTAAAVALTARVRAVGVDAEPALTLPAGVLDEIALPAERAELRLLRSGHPEVCWGRLLFCIKEAVYKAWFPLTGRWLAFEDVWVRVDATGTFAASLLVAEPGPGRRGFPGRWLLRDGYLLGAAWLGAPGRASLNTRGNLHSSVARPPILGQSGRRRTPNQEASP